MAIFKDALSRAEHRRKQGRRKSFSQWLLHGEYEEFEVYEPRRQKGVKDGAYRDDFHDYLPRDPKRETRKPSSRRVKGTIQESEYSTRW